MISDVLSMSLHLLYIIAVFTLILSTICCLASSFFKKRLKRFNPKSKLILLRGFGVLPLAGAILLAIMVTVPALNHDTVLPIDHCHANSSCFGVPMPHMVTISELMIAGSITYLFMWAFLSAVRQYQRICKLSKRLDFISELTDEKNFKIIESSSPMAFSIGLFKPMAVISSGLKSQLSSRQVRIVSIHEETHIKYRDSLYKWLMRAACTFHFPSVKKDILQQHALVLEIRADQVAAQTIQSKLDVAETIITVNKLMSTKDQPEPLCHFLASELEQRVHYLLVSIPEQSLSKNVVKLTATIVLIASVGLSVPLHNAIEFLITR